MDFVAILVVVASSSIIGYVFGRRADRTRGEEMASNLAIASFVVTMDDTYGQKWREEFVEAVQENIKTETEEIAKLAWYMSKVQHKK